MTEHMPFDFYVASCTSEGGIYRVSVTEGKMKKEGFYPCPCPMYMAMQPRKMTVLLLNPYTNSRESGVLTWCVSEDGELYAPSETVGTSGIEACHAAVVGEDTYIANYTDGSVCHVGGRTVRHSGRGKDPIRQDGPHCHCVCPTPDGRYILCADLGTDTVYVYDRHLQEVSRSKVPEGEGCRHLVCSRDGRYVYCINELGCTVTVFEFCGGVLMRHGTYAITDKRDGGSTAAAIRLSEDGRFLYASVRGEDTVTVFSVRSSEPVRLGAVSTGDRQPRDFCLLSGGRWAAAANQSGGSVVLYRVHDGWLTYADRLEIPQALCIAERQI